MTISARIFLSHGKRCKQEMCFQHWIQNYEETKLQASDFVLHDKHLIILKKFTLAILWWKPSTLCDKKIKVSSIISHNDMWIGTETEILMFDNNYEIGANTWMVLRNMYKQNQHSQPGMLRTSEPFRERKILKSCCNSLALYKSSLNFEQQFIIKWARGQTRTYWSANFTDFLLVVLVSYLDHIFVNTTLNQMQNILTHSDKILKIWRTFFLHSHGLI